MIEKAITLDFARRTSPVVVFAKQGDKDSRYITITPLNNGVPYEIPAGVSVKFACHKPDGHQVFNDLPFIDAGKITVVLTEQTLAAAGEASASVILFDDAKGQILSSQNFVLLIEENPLMNADLESSDEYQTFMSALATIDEILEAAENGSLGGTTWFFGTQVPGTMYVKDVEGAEEGDIYLNTSTKGVYKARTVDWVLVTTLAGGGSGGSGEPGRGVASATINNSGQLVLSYTDGTTETVGKVVGADGKNGADGSVWYTGTKVEADQTPYASDDVNVTPKNGDFYLNSSTGDFFVATNNSYWAKKGSLKGATGATGAAGEGADIQWYSGTYSTDTIPFSLVSGAKKGDMYYSTSTGKLYQGGSSAFTYKFTIASVGGGSGEAGEDGRGIASASINASGQLVLVYTDGQSETAGKVVGNNGADGEDGKDGVGIKSVTQTTTSTADGGSNVITVTKTDNTTSTFTVKNGSKGSTGASGNDGVGIKSVTQTTTSSADGGENVITVTKTDNTTSTFKVKNGSKGSQGATGPAGTSVSITNVSESSVDGGANIVVFSDGKTLSIKNGKTGSQGPEGPQGPAGNDGKTPTKGTDYWTAADKASIVNDVTVSLGIKTESWTFTLKDGSTVSKVVCVK